MQEWWSYRPGDFLLFSPRTYWRLFQLANEALWPLQIPVLLIGAAILAMLFRPRAWADRVIPAVLAAAWLSVSVGFLWMHYAAINWAAIYFVPVFVGEGLLVLWLGTVRGRLAFAAERGVAGVIGIALYVYALALHPLIALVAGRPLQAAEVVGIAPDRDARSPIACAPPRRDSAAHYPADHLVPGERTHPPDDGRIGGLDPVDSGGTGCLGAGLAPPERDMLHLRCCTR